MIYPRFISVLFFLVTIRAGAQEIKNIRADFDGEKVIVFYDLVSEQPDDKFLIQIFYSIDNYQAPLSLLVGDAGENISSGSVRKVTWDAKSSLPPDFNDDVSFKIRAKLIVSLHDPMRLELKPLDFNAYKRGGNLNLEWNGGKEGELINIELYKGDKLVDQIVEVENSNIYSWSIPKKAKPGKDYSIRISKATNADINTLTQDFQIKPKASIWVKVVPVVVVGGIVAILVGGKEKDQGPDLPGPITPGG